MGPLGASICPLPLAHLCSPPGAQSPISLSSASPSQLAGWACSEGPSSLAPHPSETERNRLECMSLSREGNRPWSRHSLQALLH